MCWPVEEMRALGEEYPELERLIAWQAGEWDTDMDEARDELGESAGMWFDYGLEDFQNPQARRNVALKLISYLRGEQGIAQKDFLSR